MMKNPPPKTAAEEGLLSSDSDGDADSPPLTPNLSLAAAGDGDGGDLDSIWRRRRGTGAVMLEGYVEGVGDGSDAGSEGGGEGSVGRTKSLTDDDLEELRGCLDLGFGFSYDEIPELCGTLPALELCYSLSQKYLDDQHQKAAAADGAVKEACAAPPAPPIANWKISSPGDDPEDVKARLKYWAQAVACTVRLCN